MTKLTVNEYPVVPDILDKQVILVTGAGEGLGRATALACAAHGATVILLGRTEAKLEQVYDTIEELGYPQPALVPINLASATLTEYEQLTEHIERTMGRLDGVVHNAATLGVLSPIEHLSPEIWLKTLQVNLTAPFLLTRTCIPLLKKSPSSAVIFISDEVGRRGRAYWGSYAVAKAGLERLMEMLADELENTGVRVNSFDPGRLRTLLRARAYPGEDPNTVPLPETAVPAILYLLGEKEGPRGKALKI